MRPGHLLASLLAGGSLAASPSLAQWSTAQLSVARAELAATSVGGVALFAGGSGLQGQAPALFDTVDVYDAASGTWSVAPPLSVPRRLLGAASAGGRAFFGGGVDAAGDSSALDIFVAASGAWSASQLPTVAGETVATSVGALVFFSDGTHVDILDTATGAWTSTLLSVPRIGVAAAVAGDRVVFAGGRTAFGVVDAVDIYDVGTQTWSLAALPTTQAWMAATSVGGKALFAGGTGGPGAPNATAVHVYDGATGAWTLEHLSVGRYALAATAIGQRAFFGGGRDFWAPFDTVDVFDVVTGAWTVEALPSPRGALAATSLGSRALFAGGNDSSVTCMCGGPSAVVDVRDDAVGARYCTPATANSTGSAAELSVLGWPGSAAQGALHLTARGLPVGANGYFLASRTQASVAGPGGSQGTLCLGGAIGRFVGPGQVLTAGADGRFSLPVDLASMPQPTGAVAAQAGETWSFQAWYRDVNPGPTSNFTDAVGVTLQ